MVKLQEVVRTAINSNWKKRYTYEVRDIFINPDHIQYIKPNTNKQLLSARTGSRNYCTLLVQGKELTIVGTMKELEEKLFSNKKILHD